MNRISIRRIALLGAALAPMLVAGCAEDQERRITFATWKQAEPVPQAQVSELPVHHSINFSGGEPSAFSETEREALQIFLRRNGIAPGSRVTLSSALPENGDPALLGQRLSAVRNELAYLGYSTATLPPGTSAGVAPAPGIVVVTARVLAVVPPPCPGYNTPIQLDAEHRPILSIGCANATNLGMMVADPGDLQGGKPLSPADGAASAAAIQRYRANEVWPASAPSSAVPWGEPTSDDN